MKAKPDCIACLRKQAENTARIATDDPALRREIVDSCLRYAATASLDQTPAALSKPVYCMVADMTATQDPFKVSKQKTNRMALSLKPDLELAMNTAPDPLDTALRIAAAGNIIDLGIGDNFNVDHKIHVPLDQDLAVNVIEEFRSELRPGRKILYLGDNAGEIVFDSLLVRCLQSMGVVVTFAVKSGPIINDATMEDAKVAGITEMARVIETGGDDIGIDWDNVSGEFMEAFASADAIIAKGHGNFETCHDHPGNFYFLLKVKCQMVADEIGARLGDIVFTRGTPAHSRASIC